MAQVYSADSTVSSLAAEIKPERRSQSQKQKQKQKQMWLAAEGTQVERNTGEVKRILSEHQEASSIDFFPHLPPYSDPRTGFVSCLPRACIPYAQLMRLERPAGLYAFYFPYLIGILYGANIAEPKPDSSTLLWLAIFFLPFCVVMRGAVCTWNDNLDQRFDRKVERCRHRPIARGAISTAAGHIFTAVQLVALWPFVVVLPVQCTRHIVPTVVLFLIYALMKRVTYYPQVVLGFPFAWSVFICTAAYGIDLSDTQLLSSLALFASQVCWTTTYDTIYAHQDIADDEKAGVKGMAVRFRNSTKLLAGCLTLVQVGLLILSGHLAAFGPAYYVGTVGGVALTMGSYIHYVDLKRPLSCGQWFHVQFWTVGAGYALGLLGEYYVRVAG